MKNLVGVIARENHEAFPPFGKLRFFLEDMITEGKELPFSVFVFSPLNWEKGKSKVSGFRFENQQWIKCTEQIPKILYDKFTNKPPEIPIDFNVFIDEMLQTGKEFTTPRTLVNLIKNKVEFHKYLQEKDINTLEAILLSELTEKSFKQLYKRTKELYIKPIDGSNGEGIAFFEKQTQFGILKERDKTTVIPINECYGYIKSNFDNNEYFIQPKADYLEFEGKANDIRVLIQNQGNAHYTVTGQGLRVGKKGDWISNLSAGGNALPLEKLKTTLNQNGQDLEKTLLDIKTLCLNCTQVLHEEFGEFAEIAYDILLTKTNGPIILEANSKPGRWIFVMLADNYPQNSEEYLTYMNLRKLSTKMPLTYIAQKYFNNN